MRRWLLLLASVALLGAGPLAQAPLENPGGELTLENAVRLALMQSAELQAFDAGRRAAEARQLAAGWRPNPAAGLLAEDVGAGQRDGVQPQVTLQISHLIELGQKRAARMGVAGRDRALADIDYEAARLLVVSRIGEAFREVLADQAGAIHTARALGLAQEVHRTAQVRVEAGVASPIEVTRSELLVVAAERDDTAARYALVASRTRLSSLWGAADPRFARVVGDLTIMPDVPPLPALEAQATASPSALRWTIAVERRRAELAQARAAAVPDVTVHAGYRRHTTTGGQGVIVGGTIDLPLFGRTRDAQAAVVADIARAEADAEAARREVRLALHTAVAALAASREAALGLRDRAIPAARSVFEAVREGYSLGRFSLMDVLDAQRALAGTERDHLDALVAFHAAVAAIERLTGHPLPSPGARQVP